MGLINRLGKYKYYFKKSKSEIVKDVLNLLAMTSIFVIAANSPYFARNILKSYKKWKKFSKKRVVDTFYNLKRQGLIQIEKKGKQIYISLTEKGKKKAGIFQINNLKVEKPKKWDRKWRVVIFDISELKKINREAFRGKLKELGFYQLQKSVWAHPYDCRAEIELLRDFFGLREEELRLMVVEKIESDEKIKSFFKLT